MPKPSEQAKAAFTKLVPGGPTLTATPRGGDPRLALRLALGLPVSLGVGAWSDDCGLRCGGDDLGFRGGGGGFGLRSHRDVAAERGAILDDEPCDAHVAVRDPERATTRRLRAVTGPLTLPRMFTSPPASDALTLASSSTSTSPVAWISPCTVPLRRTSPSMWSSPIKRSRGPRVTPLRWPASGGG